jgi:hypothetical protein
MPGVLTEFVVRLALDPEASAQFAASPERALAALDTGALSADHIALLRAGDARRLYDVLAADGSSPATVLGRTLEHPGELPVDPPEAIEYPPEPGETPGEAIEMHPGA